MEIEWQDALTRVAFSSPASVCPTRIDSSSVANESNYSTATSDQAPGREQFTDELTLASGIIARKETAQPGQYP